MSFRPNAKTFTPEVKVTNKTNEALATEMTNDATYGQEILARINKTKEVANEMLAKLQADNVYSSNAKVDVRPYTNKDGVKAVSASITFSGRVNPKDKDSIKHDLILSVKEDGTISYVKAGYFDHKANTYNEVKFNEMAESLKTLKDKLADYGYVKAYAKSEKTPFEKTVSAFKSAVYEYNEAHPDAKITMGHGVYDENKQPVMGEDGKRLWNDVTTREYEGKEYLSIDIAPRGESNEMFKFNIDREGAITSANYLNFDNKEESTFTYDLNRWKGQDSFISDVIETALTKFDYVVPKPPTKGEQDKQQEDFMEMTEEEEAELPFQ